MAACTALLALLTLTVLAASRRLIQRQDEEATARLLAEGFASEALGRGEAKVGPIGPIHAGKLRWLAPARLAPSALAGDPVVTRRVLLLADGKRHTTIDIVWRGGRIACGVDLPPPGRWPWPEGKP